MKNLQKAFLLNHYDIQLNKIIFFLLAKSGNPRSAIEFGERIYPAFSNCLWLNYTLGLHYQNEGLFDQAEKYLLKCI